jgi:hypothetical protein
MMARRMWSATVVADSSRVRQRDGEFLAAVARGDILALDVLLHRYGDEAEHLIAGHMAVFVIERLEVIDVGHQ